MIYGYEYATNATFVGELFYLFQCVKSVQIRSFFWSFFSRIRTDCVFSPNAEKYGTDKTPYLDTFHAVIYSRHPCKLPLRLVDLYRLSQS